MSDQGVEIDAARKVRPYLTDLVEERSSDFDTRIAELLEQHSRGADVTESLRLVFESDESLQEWLAEFSDDPTRIPPEFQSVRSAGYDPLPGHGNVIPPPQWICPLGNDYVVYQHSSDPAPQCPTHQVALVPAF